MYLLSDYQKEFDNTYKLNVGDSFLNVRTPSLSFLSMLHSDYIENESLISLYKPIIMLFVETPSEVFSAFSKIVEEPLDDFSSYDDLVKEEIVHSTYKFLMGLSVSNSYNFVSSFSLAFNKINKNSLSNFELAHKDMKMALVKNFGYRYSDVQKLSYDSLLDILLNEIIIHGDTSFFIFLFQRLVSSFAELNDLFPKDYVDDLCKDVLLKFQKFTHDCYNEDVRNELNDLLIKFKIPYDINGDYIKYTSDGKAKLESKIQLPGSISAEDFLKKLEEG